MAYLTLVTSCQTSTASACADNSAAKDTLASTGLGSSSRIVAPQAVQISAAGLLIVVGVVLDTMRQLEAQMMMRNYEGFIS